MGLVTPTVGQLSCVACNTYCRVGEVSCGRLYDVVSSLAVT